MSRRDLTAPLTGMTAQARSFLAAATPTAQRISLGLGLQTGLTAIPGDFGNASTPTAAQFVAGWLPILPTMATTCTTPSAADIVAAVPLAYVGQVFDVLVNVKALFAVTVTPGAGFTLNGSGVVGSAFVIQAQRFRCRIDNVTGGAEAITMFRG